jgi:hypothetical protein
MYPSNNMNSFPFSHMPTIWFVSRRENLETFHQELSNLRDKVTRFAGGQNVIAMLEAAESLKQLNEQVRSMEEIFESNLSPYIDEYDPYNKNNLRRIRELASSISSHLETIAEQVSWGIKADAQIAQVKRNLYPLLRGLEDTLEWLERGI